LKRHISRAKVQSALDTVRKQENDPLHIFILALIVELSCSGMQGVFYRVHRCLFSAATRNCSTAPLASPMSKRIPSKEMYVRIIYH
jgi:hypothetical protein